MQGNYQSSTARAQNVATPTSAAAPVVAAPGIPAALAAVAAGAQANAAGAQIRTNIPGAIQVPNSALYRINTNPANTFVVQTDPRFTNLRQWLSSDYMLTALNTHPSNITKRLGDGFYEQRLINEQVAQLTGRRFLGNYTSQDQQYQALMDAGITVARSFNLRPGIALSATQMAQLTSDIVWLVEQTVTLADGSQIAALVPQVYVANVRPGDIDGSGALLAAQAININVAGDVNNSGSIGGGFTGNVGSRPLVSINASNINNLMGRIQGDQVSLSATNDITNTGGALGAASALSLNAGRDINLTSTTTSNKGNNSAFSITQIDRLAGVYVTGLGNTPGRLPGSLNITAGRDINAQAASIANTSTGGNTNIQASRDITLSTVSTDFAASVGGGANFMRMQTSQDVGSSISTQGDLTIKAGNNLTATAATVQSSQGNTQLTAGNSISLLAGQRTNDLAWGGQSSSSGFMSSSTTTRRETASSTQAVGTQVGGNNVNVNATQDINIKGSSVIADKDATLRAGNNINIEAAVNTSSQTSFTETKESGFLSGGGFGITYGSRTQSLDQKSKSTTAAASTVGAIAGNITATAGNQFRQVGSDLIAPVGDINILAKKVDIIEARETSSSTTEQKFKQTAITASISNPVVSAIQSVQSVAQAAGQTSSGRMQTLAAASAGLTAYNTVNSLTDKAGNFDAKAATDVRITLSLGTSKSQSNSSSQSDTARGSTVGAGRNINITATGAGQDSNILIQGSDVKAANNVSLTADNQVNLLAAKNESSQSSTNSSSSSSASVSWGPAGGWGGGASASRGKGKSDGEDTTFTNTNVSAGNTATIKSGGDTNLIGATVEGNQIKAEVGGDLNIKSLQDKSTFNSSQSSMNASVSVGGAGNGASVGASKSNIDSSFASVNQKSGLKAGDGGFQVDVAKNTALVGAVIASNQAALENARNSFRTGGSLSITDIQNTASFKGSGYSVSASFSQQQDKEGNAVKDINGNNVYKPGGSFGVGSTVGNASSISSAGITGIAGDTSVRTGDAETGLQRIFNADKVQKEINAQIAITQAFGPQASKAIGDYAQVKTDEAKALRSQAGQEGISQERKDSLNAQAQTLEDNWGRNGTLLLLAHTAVGGLTGGVSGAAGAAAGTLTGPVVADALRSAGVDGALATTITALASTAAGALAGGTSGAAAGFNEVVNNYLNHTQWDALAKELAAAKTDADRKKINEKYAMLSKAQDAILATCDARGDCATLTKEVFAGTQEQIRLIKTKQLPDYYAGGSDLQFMGQKLATNASFRQQVGQSVNYMAWCSTNKSACDQDQMKKAIVLAGPVIVPLIGGSVGALAINALVNSGRMLATEAALIYQMGGPVGYCSIKPDNCMMIVEAAASIATNTNAPSVLPTNVASKGLSKLEQEMVSAGGGARGGVGVNGGVAATTVITPAMETKILYGERVVNTSGTPTNRLIGAHGGEIANSNPSYAVEVLSLNGDGTRNAKLVTQFSDGNISNIKTSTLFPENWTPSQSIGAVKQVGDLVPVATRADGAALYQSTVNGVQIEVIKIGNNVTAGYPVGSRGFQTTTYF